MGNRWEVSGSSIGFHAAPDVLRVRVWLVGQCTVACAVSVLNPGDLHGLTTHQAHTDNAVHAIRYTFTGEHQGQSYGRQWTFYFFSNGETVVSLHDVPPEVIALDYISTYNQNVWRADDGPPYWDGEYFCFYDNGAGDFVFSGTCEPAPPPPPEEILGDGFEGE